MQFWSDWKQFINPKRYSWIVFRPAYLEFEWERRLGAGLTIEIGLLGFNLRFSHSFAESKFFKKLKKEAELVSKGKSKKKYKTIYKRKDGWKIEASPEVISKLESILPDKK